MPNGFQVQTLAGHPVYTMIAGDTKPGIVLEVPFGVRSGTDRIGTGERLNFYQPRHRRRMINGMIARVPLVALDIPRLAGADVSGCGCSRPAW